MHIRLLLRLMQEIDAKHEMVHLIRRFRFFNDRIKHMINVHINHMGVV